jgi:hypothetical protein
MVRAVRVECLKPAPLSIVTDGATEICEFVPALPAPILLLVAKGFCVGMSFEWFGEILKARVIGGNMTGRATVNPLATKPRNHNLFDLRFATLKVGAFGVFFCHRPRLIKVSGLVALPLMKKLVEENNAVDD